MKRHLIFAALLTVTLSLCGCVIVNFSGFNAVNGRGDPESFEFRVDEFNRVRVDGHIEIHHYAAASDTVKLEIQPNLLEHFIVEVKDDELVVRSTRNINFNSSKRPVLTVSAPVLEGLTITGAFDFTAHDKINSDSLRLNLSGAGTGRAEVDVGSLSVNVIGASNFVLSGLADTADIVLSGASDLDALTLQTREAAIRLSGASSAGISSSESLMVNASGAGSVTYRGSPSLNLNTSGPVSVRKVE